MELYAPILLLHQNSNRKLDEWIQSLRGRGYHVYYANFRSTTSMREAESFANFQTMLTDHEVTETYWYWTQLAFPFQIIYGKIWFIDEETTYYLQTW